jgi:hypothetical protein
MAKFLEQLILLLQRPAVSESTYLALVRAVDQLEAVTR